MQEASFLTGESRGSSNSELAGQAVWEGQGCRSSGSHPHLDDIQNEENK